MRKWRTHFTQESGSASIEFAVLVGLIVLVAFAATKVVGSESERAFAALTDKSLHTSVAADRNGSVSDTHDAHAPVAEAKRGFEVTIDQDPMLALIGCIGIVAWQSHHRKRLRRIRERGEHEADRQLIERLDSKRFAKRQEILKVLEADPTALVQGRVEVRHLMTTGLSTVDHKASLKEMKAIMAEQHVRHFPVSQEGWNLAGNRQRS